MTPIETPLDAALDAWDAKKEARSRAAFSGHRKRILATPDAHPLQRTRLNFRGYGLTVEELSARSTVGASTIRAIEAGGQASDATWARLCLGLGVRDRCRIDPTFVR